jgi:hypothetical protein
MQQSRIHSTYYLACHPYGDVHHRNHTRSLEIYRWRCLDSVDGNVHSSIIDSWCEREPIEPNVYRIQLSPEYVPLCD